MRQINYESDFDFALTLTDAQGAPVGFPDCDFRVAVFAKAFASKKYWASSQGGVLTNLRNDGGAVRVICDNHRLGRGELMAKIYADIPDGLYADGIRLTVTPLPLGITLVDAPSDGAGEVDIEASMPIAVVGAYQIAVAQGYQGTAQEYSAILASLPGWSQTLQATSEQTQALASEPLARTDRNNNFSASQTVTGTFTVYGDIVQSGKTYVTEAETVKSRNSYVIVRDGAVGGLGANERAGIEVRLYDGENDGVIEVGADGVARVGDKGDAQPLLTRAEASLLQDGDLLVWDASAQRAVPMQADIVDMEVTYEDDTTDTFQVICKRNGGQ